MSKFFAQNIDKCGNVFIFNPHSDPLSETTCF